MFLGLYRHFASARRILFDVSSSTLSDACLNPVRNLKLVRLGPVPPAHYAPKSSASLKTTSQPFETSSSPETFWSSPEYLACNPSQPKHKPRKGLNVVGLSQPASSTAGPAMQAGPGRRVEAV